MQKGLLPVLLSVLAGCQTPRSVRDAERPISYYAVPMPVSEPVPVQVVRPVELAPAPIYCESVTGGPFWDAYPVGYPVHYPGGVRHCHDHRRHGHGHSRRAGVASPTVNRGTVRPLVCRPAVSRSAVSRPVAARPAGSRPAWHRPSASRPSGGHPFGNGRPSGVRPTGMRPSGNRPAGARPSGGGRRR